MESVLTGSSDQYVFVIEEYTSHGYLHLVHVVVFDVSQDGWWGAKLACSGIIVDGGKLPVKTHNLSRELTVTCLTCVANAKTSPSSTGNP